jgi:hypothetical protein
VGYDEHSAAYRVYIPQTRKIMKSGHVIFNERGRMEYGSIMDNADIDDWFLGLDENGNSVIRVYGAPVPRDSVGGDAVVPEQDMVLMSYWNVLDFMKKSKNKLRKSVRPQHALIAVFLVQTIDGCTIHQCPEQGARMHTLFTM